MYRQYGHALEAATGRARAKASPEALDDDSDADDDDMNEDPPAEESPERPSASEGGGSARNEAPEAVASDSEEDHCD